MAARHYTGSPVPNQISSSPAAQTVPFELVGTGFYVLIQRRRDGRVQGMLQGGVK